MAHVVSVNVGRVVPFDGASRLDRTAIDKRPVTGPVAVGPLGFASDEQADRTVHGGIDQAVYAYAREDLDWWAGQLGRDLRDGQFGENLTTRGVDVTGAVLGERWRVGAALLEVSSPRIPCVTFQNFLGERAWVRRFTKAARPGAYLRVLEPSEVGAGDEIEVVHSPEHALTIGDTFMVMTRQRDLVPWMLDVPNLPLSVREWARQHLTST